MSVSERESVCVSERKSVCVCQREREREKTRERERERESKGVNEVFFIVFFVRLKHVLFG